MAVYYGAWNAHGQTLAMRAVTAGGTVTAGQIVARQTDDGLYDAVADNGTTGHAVAANSAVVSGSLTIYEAGDGVVFRTSYAGSDPTVTGYDDFYGWDGNQPDLADTTNKLVRLRKTGTFPNGTAYCDWELPSAKAFAEVS